MVIETETIKSGPSLDDLVAVSVRALLRRFHLNRDWIIGLIGERGAGKSLGGANIVVRDFAMSGEPIWSNMNIGLQVGVPDTLSYPLLGIPGGTVTYQSEYIEKQRFLALDSRYENGCLMFDEFNLEYGESRRSSANVNLMTDTAIQQLRKISCGLVYTVLNESYVDVRIRENTDVFIKCFDVAMKSNNLTAKMQQGVTFEWLIYAMSPRLCGHGNTYSETKKPFGPYRVTLKDWWDTIDTYEKQAKGARNYSKIDMPEKTLIPLDIKEDPETIRYRYDWGWLDDGLNRFLKAHRDDGDIIEITSQEFAEELGVDKNRWGAIVAQITRRIPNMEWRGHGWRGKRYIIPNRLTKEVKKLTDD